MKATLLNRIKVWWHCLIHFHQQIDYTEGKEIFGIYIPLRRIKVGCWTCSYGEEKDIEKGVSNARKD